MVQRFLVNQRDPPALHRALVKCVNKYGLKFEAINPPAEILRAMPLWHHPGEDSGRRQENKGQRARCLRKNHAALEMGDGVDIATRLMDPQHSDPASCTCNGCTEDRDRRGCEDPHAWVAKAASRLQQICPRWVPSPDDQGGETEPAGHDDESGVFVAPAQIASLSQGLRTMTNREGEPVERPVPRIRRRVIETPTPQNAVIYAVGVIHTPPGKAATAAAAFSIEGCEPVQVGKRLPTANDQLQYVAEFFATLMAIRNVKDSTTLTIYSTQLYVREAMNKKLQRWEHEGWVGVQNRDIL
ncbi:hypothetical protein GGX14DRAFT_362172 [Mycena pura]|uniref:RNase H type-1 domain-containing protein n=1 Tax=Mycena pura TaxID=153505 RepID=A0AAD6VG54_9AGAR|nr:hypothetical protein GGX14DRAFT_362172 [Mycena pura]